MSVEWDGLDELRQALRDCPGEFATEGGNIVEAATNAAVVAIKAGYGDKAELRDKTSGTVERNRYGALGTVRSASPLAWIFENGTQVRHTALGANRGAIQPPGHVVVPVAQRERRRMREDLKAMVEGHKLGFEVVGDA